MLTFNTLALACGIYAVVLFLVALTFIWRPLLRHPGL